MPTSRPDDPGTGVVTFTALGDAALDQLACSLAAECDGSPGSIMEILTHVCGADVQDLVDALNENIPRRLSR